MWEPRQSRRVAWLTHTPCPLEILVARGLHIGIDPVLFPELMWLTEVVLASQKEATLDFRVNYKTARRGEVRMGSWRITLPGVHASLLLPSPAPFLLLPTPFIATPSVHFLCPRFAC